MTAVTASYDRGEELLTLEYRLAGLPSPQHRAGLAGLVLMVEHLGRRPSAEQRGRCSIDHDTHSARLAVDAQGVGALLDLVYGAASVERPYPRPFKNKPPLYEKEVEETNKAGKPKIKTVYYYPVVVPRGGFLDEWWGESHPAWIKLWRDMIWNIMRGVPATRKPFEARAVGRPDKLARDTWAELAAAEQRDKSVDLPSTYYLGAQAKTAENVTFRDRGRLRFLLHFWPFVAPIYVPQVIEPDGKRKTPRNSYAIVVPDVAELDIFCEEFAEFSRHGRSDELAGYVPRDAVVDLPVEGALDMLARMHAHVRHSPGGYAELVYGVDVFHVSKDGNNVRVRATARIDVDDELETEYQRVKRSYRDGRFRRQLLRNLLDPRRPAWHEGFDRIAATVSTDQTVASPWFCADARRAFSDHEETMKENGDGSESRAPDTIESLVLRIARGYVKGKLESKHGYKWSTHGESKEFKEATQKLALDAFLAVRSRTGAEFTNYFSGTLCSVPQFMTEAQFRLVSTALLEDTDKVRTLTLLALSASGYTKRASDENKGSGAE